MPYPTPEEERWARAIEAAHFGVWDLDPRLELVHYSPQWKARLGFPRIEAPDSTAFWRCRVHPEDFDTMLGTLRAHLDGHAPSYEMRFRLRSNGAGYRSVLSRGRVVARDHRGNATRMIGTMIDLAGALPGQVPYGLAAEDPAHAAPAPRVPFHAQLGIASAPDGPSVCGEPQGPRLAELIEDLLDIALREAAGVR